jgi:hypothetical protein
VGKFVELSDHAGLTVTDLGGSGGGNTTSSSATRLLPPSLGFKRSGQNVIRAAGDRIAIQNVPSMGVNTVRVIRRDGDRASELEWPGKLMGAEDVGRGDGRLQWFVTAGDGMSGARRDRWTVFDANTGNEVWTLDGERSPSLWGGMVGMYAILVEEGSSAGIDVPSGYPRAYPGGGTPAEPNTVLRAIDAADPSAPRATDLVELPVWSLAVDDSAAYVVGGCDSDPTGSNTCLLVFEVHGGLLVETGRLEWLWEGAVPRPEERPRPQVLAAEEGLLVVADGNRIRLLDATEPGALHWRGEVSIAPVPWSLGASSNAVVLKDAVLYLSSQAGLHLIDVADRDRPKQMSVFRLGSWPNGLAVTETAVYVADEAGYWILKPPG